jgi:TetR/AcrR family acrAB operon transcriptional repressor
MRRIKEEADQTRQNLMDIALRVFLREGYLNTHLDTIAQEAGVTRGAIYHHFGSKLGLYNALAEGYTRQTHTMIADIIARGNSPLATLRSLILNTILIITSDEHYRAVSELMIFKTGAAPELNEGIESKKRWVLTATEQLAGLVVDAQRQGEIREDVSPRDVAAGLLALQNGLTTLWIMNPQTINLSKSAEAIVDHYLNGIAPH